MKKVKEKKKKIKNQKTAIQKLENEKKKKTKITSHSWKIKSSYSKVNKIKVECSISNENKRN